MNIIRVFCMPHEDNRDVDCIAIDEQGKFITAQVCSNYTWMKKDMVCDFHKWFYNQRYPAGYELIFFDRFNIPNGWDGQRKHTDDSVKPWHLDPVNNSTLFKE